MRPNKDRRTEIILYGLLLIPLLFTAAALAQATEQAQGLAEITAVLSEILHTEPDRLDPTLQSVERVAKNNGYDSFLMFNVYAQRATRPNDMERVCNEALHRANMEAFDYILSLSEQPAVWAAWGNIIEQRAYLKDCLADMIAIGERHGAQWYTAGRRSVKGHPHHPLYLKATSPLDAFDIRAYCAECL